jgi:hypothetical protein
LIENDPLSFGDGFNEYEGNGGGIFATVWNSEVVQVFFWPAGVDTPNDISSASPDPTTWGAPVATFNACDGLSNIVDGKIVFDTNFCSSAVTAAWSSDAGCASQAVDCPTFLNSADYSNVYVFPSQHPKWD